MALVATVVPWAKNATSPGAMPWRNTSSSAFITACDGSLGTDATLAKRTSPRAGSTAIRSVNVPPASTPTIQPPICLPHGLREHADAAEATLQRRQNRIREHCQHQHQDDAE